MVEVLFECPKQSKSSSITYQNYFKLYEKISGCTGTAATESQEFYEIYNLMVVVIPTNKEMIRKDWNDQIFRTELEKNKAIINKVLDYVDDNFKDIYKDMQQKKELIDSDILTTNDTETLMSKTQSESSSSRSKIIYSTEKIEISFDIV